MGPLVIEAALNGATPKSRYRHSPQTPDEIAADALACLEAGAAVIHTHTDDFGLTGDRAVERYMQGWAPLLAARPDVVLCSTVARGATFEEKFGHYAGLAARGMRMGSLDPGSLNFAAQGEDGLPAAPRVVYTNTFQDIARLMELHREADLGPSMAVYEPGFLRAILAWDRAGKLPPGGLVKFYFGGLYNIFDGKPGNVSFGLPPTAKALEAYLEMLEGCALPWSVAVLGGDVAATGLARMAIERGGHVRVGLEDFGGERQPANAELVAEVAAIAAACGRPLATSAEAAEILGLPPR